MPHCAQTHTNLTSVAAKVALPDFVHLGVHTIKTDTLKDFGISTQHGELKTTSTTPVTSIVLFSTSHTFMNPDAFRPGSRASDTQLTTLPLAVTGGDLTHAALPLNPTPLHTSRMSSVVSSPPPPVQIGKRCL